MELSDSQQLSYLIEHLTTHGKNEVDEPNLKKLKSMCKASDECLEQAFRLLFTQLEKDHSEIRLAAVHLIDKLFRRSHAFRELLLEHFNEFLELGTGTNFDMPLPDPKAAALELVKTTVKCINAWHRKYGPAYKKLVLGYNYLRGVKKIQMASADEVQTQIQRNALRERKRQRDEWDKKSLEKVEADIVRTGPEIMSCVVEMEACFALLVPKFIEEEGVASNSELKNMESRSRESGIVSHDYTIELSFPNDMRSFVKIKRDQDNEVILENLKDREKLLRNVHLEKVKMWLVKLGSHGAPAELLKRGIDLKAVVVKTLEKFKDLIVMQDSDSNVPSTSGLQENTSCPYSDESTDDDDFVEVLEKPKVLWSAKSDSVGTRPCKVGMKDSSGGTNIWKPIRDNDDLNDPASYSRALAVQRNHMKRKAQGRNSAKDGKLVKIHPKSKQADLSSNFSEAPVVPFGPDLLEWDEEKKQELKETLSMGRARELDIGHRFWSGDTASKGEEVSDAALTVVTNRSIAFVGQFEPVKRSCRAPLPNGKLCPREDRFKCPFHGTIIPRDERGHPANQEDQGLLLQPNSKKYPDWQDPNLMRELKAITGIDLKMPQKKSSGKHKKTAKYEHLTDVGDLKNTSRYRLRKKVFDPKSVKRVSETLDRIEARRNFQKFGNNFNYALN